MSLKMPYNFVILSTMDRQIQWDKETYAEYSSYNLNDTLKKSVLLGIEKNEFPSYGLLFYDYDRKHYAFYVRFESPVVTAESNNWDYKIRFEYKILGTTNITGEDIHNQTFNAYNVHTVTKLMKFMSEPLFKSYLNKHNKKISTNTPREVEQMKFDLAIIAALEEELRPLLDIKPVNWTEYYVGNEYTTYHIGTFNNGKKEFKVVAAHAPQMGIAAATLLSLNMINFFRPEYLGMIGIAAGVKNDSINCGDILITESSFDYGSGKIVTNDDGSSEFRPDFKKLATESTLSGKLNRNHSRILGKIYESAEMTKPRGIPEKLFGPVASGAMVVAHNDIVQQILKHERKLIGIDMETYGVYYAANHCTEPRPKAFSIKAICDFADGEKNDIYHKYAAFVSATYMYEFALEELMK